MKLLPLEHIDIEVIDSCNLDCIHCSASKKLDKIPIMTSDDIIRILSEAKKLSLKKVGFTGGEPLTDFPKLKTITEHCLKNDILQIHLHTNGTLITPRIAEWLKENEIETTLTLFGATAEIHEGITNTVGSYSKTIAGLKHMLAENADISVFVVPMNTNYRDVPNLIRKTIEMGCKDIRILSLSPTGSALTDYIKLELSVNEIKFLNSEFKKLVKEYREIINAGFCTRLNHPMLPNRPGHDQCYSASNRVHIDSYGNVFPCTAASGRKEFSAGNILLYDYSIEDLWQNSPLFQFIRKFHKYPEDQCQECDQFYSCMGGCRIQLAYKYGDFTITDPDCARRRIK